MCIYMDKVTSMRLHTSTVDRLKKLRIIKDEPLESALKRVLDSYEKK